MLMDTGVGAFLTDKELPKCLDSWTNCLKNDSKNNVGLALRWEAGLAAMEALSAIPDDSKMQMSNEWASAVKKMVDEASSSLETFCVERSIVSIRIAKQGGGWLDMDEARQLYKWMSLDVSAAVPAATPEEKLALSTATFIGQPVSVSESHAIVRIALGAESLLSYSLDAEETLQEDQLAVAKLAAIAKYFHILKDNSR